MGIDVLLVDQNKEKNTCLEKESWSNYKKDTWIRQSLCRQVISFRNAKFATAPIEIDGYMIKRAGLLR